MASQGQDDASFDSFASKLVSHLRALPNHTDASLTNGIVELVHLLARQFKAFQAGQHSCSGPDASAPDSNANAPAPPSVAQCQALEETSSDEELVGENYNGIRDSEFEGDENYNGNSDSEFEGDENFNGGENFNGSGYFEGDENSNGQAEEELVFEVKRKSRSGEALHLTPAVLSPLFGLLLREAEEELGISRTTLKKALRFFGVRRWPGRKVRGLESTIAKIEQKLVDQGAASKEVAGMWSELPKLKQELNELRQGTIAQIRKNMLSSATVITKNAYRRLYYSNTKNRTRGPAAPPAGETSSEADVNEAAIEAKQSDPVVYTDGRPANQPSEPAPNADNESPRPSSCKFIRPKPRRSTRQSLRKDSEMPASDLEGLLPEVVENAAGREVPQSASGAVVLSQHDHEMLPPKKKNREEGAGDGKGALGDEGATGGELLSAKLPKTEPLCSGRCSNCGKTNYGKTKSRGNNSAPALTTGEGSMAAVIKFE